MEIILGVFFSETFSYVEITTGALKYPFGLDASDGILVKVEKACQQAEKIHFVLDRLYLPLTESSITCRELILIMENQWIGKVQFWLEEKKIATEKVVSLIRTVKEEKLTFEHIDFETF